MFDGEVLECTSRILDVTCPEALESADVKILRNLLARQPIRLELTNFQKTRFLH